MTTRTAPTVNAMTVDVEDYFQVSAFEPYVSRDDWSSFNYRVEQNTDRILEMFSMNDVRATFFTLGWVASQFPDLVRRIVDAGHDLASHGWEHQRVTTMNKQEFALDLRKSKEILEDVSGTEVNGFRAPSYSFTKQNPWTHEVLLNEGYFYSSSIAPIRHDLYGIPGAPRFAHRYENDKVLELPITTTRLFNKNYPCGGGGWFRLYPYKISKWAISRVNRKDQEAAIFYFHPWEIDPEQPAIENIDRRTKFRHYQNLVHMERKVTALLQDFSWRPIPEVFADELKLVDR